MNELKKILMVFGTRPEAIKMAPLFHELNKHKSNFKVSVCVTGQHKEMLDQVLSTFQIIPDFDLNLMKDGQDLFDLSSSTLLAMRDVIKKENPQLILVHGDTTTSNIAATSSFYLDIPIGHVEAGLRTCDLKSPFPEEFNRQLISMIADFHFAPTEKSRTNLEKEGVKANSIFVTGNTVIDALFWILNKISNDKKLEQDITNNINKYLNFDWLNDNFILITGHRRESFGEGFENICKAIKELSEKYKNIKFVYPVHLNPNVQRPVKKILSNLENVYLIDPLEYESFVYLMKASYLILTDSGGIQEEAPSLGKPVIVMRNSTERPEAVEAGTVKLAGNKKETIVESISNLIENAEEYNKMAKSYNPYGDGKSSQNISEILKRIEL